MERSTIEGVREYNFDPQKVIEGLNGYYESEPRNGYIRVYRDFGGLVPVYLGVNVWLSALIEWLREDHDIFYKPGMDIRDSAEPGLTLDQVEAARSAAKICCLRATIKDEFSKRDLWFDKNADIPELIDMLFKAYDVYDEYNKALDRNAERETRKAVNEQLKKDTDYVADTLCDILEALGISKSDTVHLDIPGLKTKAIQRASLIKSERDRYLKQRDTAVADYQAVCEDTRKECYNYLWNALEKLSPECDAIKIDRYEDLVDRIFYEMSLINGNCKQCQRKRSTEKFNYIRRTNKAEEELKKLKEQLDKATADYQALSEENQELKTSQKSDVNKLIRDYCTKNGIIAPSRYLSDEACIEYLFSVSSKDDAKRAFESILFYLLSYWERLGYDRHDILHEGVSSPSLTLTIEKLIDKYAEKDRQAQTCDVELKRARDTIDTLKCLMDAVNAELEDY